MNTPKMPLLLLLLRGEESFHRKSLMKIQVLLGMDSELDAVYSKNPSPVSNWEIERLKLRSFVDNTMRCISSVEAIHQLTRNIATLAVSNYVSQLVNSSVEFLDDGVSKMFRDGVISLDSVLKARFLADKFINEPSLLGLLHFSYDMKLAVYLPLAFPILMPVASSILAVVKRLIYDTQKQ
ncbi:hypothetical protein QR680_002260 [Steinernema hermaphroditum]|uniref:GPI transamidase component PIG-S n=1 Tax=Steinernema hermaphroditum TaxID=289476 RepID=A0AA39LHE1_9BILA|nr:hypothetical protein QR680_002260 [Steinernema hermaphroditum]